MKNIRKKIEIYLKYIEYVIKIVKIKKCNITSIVFAPTTKLEALKFKL